MTDFIWSIASIVIISLIVLIGVLVIWKGLKEKKSGYPATDERTQKVNGKAAYYSMFISQYFILAILWFIFIGQEIFGMPEIEAGYPLIAALLVSALSFFVLRAYLGRKGEP
jgi:amino acid permease